MSNGLRLPIALAAVAALLAGAAPASAAAPPDLGELLECATYPSGDDICSGSVPSFDGAPLDVDLTLPRGGAAKKGLVVMLHGFGNDKHYWESNTDEGDGEDLHRWNTHWFARNGYYALTYTARGFKTSAAPADRPGTLRLPLVGNHWRLEAGHRLRHDLASVDQPTVKPNTANGTVTFGAPTLVLPTREGDQRLGEG